MKHVFVLLRAIFCAGLMAAPAQAERQQIGRAPENPEAIVAVRDLEWSRGAGRVALSLLTAERARVEVGTFPESVVFPALMFAADGRPYVVSLETAAPLYDRKVLLHPVLQDTALGCRILQIDRMAGTLQDRDDALAGVVETVRRGLGAEQAAYELAWAVRVMAALAAIDRDEFGAGALTGYPAWPSIRQFLSRAQMLAGEGASWVAPFWAELQQQKADGAAFALAKAKPEYFDPKVTALAEQCLQGSQTADGYAQCLGQGSQDDLLETLQDGQMLWGAPPPRWEIAYGIGEAPYSLRADLGAVAGAGAQARTTFVGWVNFLSLPNFLTGTGKDWYLVDNYAITEYQDREPYMLSALEGQLVQSAEALFESSAYWQTSREVLEAFTTLQRLFRLGFDERFGPEFAIERFTDLGDQTARAAFSENFRTPRWLTRPGLIEEQAFFAAKELGDMPNLGTYAPLGDYGRACTDLIDKSGFFGMSSIGAEDWQATCDPEPLLQRFSALKGRPRNLDDTGYQVQRNVLGLVRLSYARRIRSELNVARDDGFDLTGEVCPKP